MKKEIIRYTICAILILLLTLPGSAYIKNIREDSFQSRIDQAGVPEISYRTHVQDIGWLGWEKAGAATGTVGQGKGIEAIQIKIGNDAKSGSVRYRAHVQNIGWLGWCKAGETAGTTGVSLNMEAIEIELTGELAEKYNIYYRVHVQDRGWMGWACNGETAGSTGMGRRIEAIQIISTPKSVKTPPKSYNSVTQNEIKPYLDQQTWN